MTKRRPGNLDHELSPEDEAFARQSGARLRESSERLDAATLSRLNRARQRALDEMPGKTRIGIDWRLSAGLTALVAILVIGFWQMGDFQGTEIQTTPVLVEEITDFELLLGESDLEMIEDLEFFAWLSSEDLETSG